MVCSGWEDIVRVQLLEYGEAGNNLVSLCDATVCFMGEGFDSLYTRYMSGSAAECTRSWEIARSLRPSVHPDAQR